MKCVSCGHPKLKRGTTDEIVPVGALTFTVRAPALVCPKCGESYLDAETLGQVEHRVAGELAMEGADTSEAFRFMRKAIGLRAREVADLFGVTPETVSRWETGERQPADAAVKLLAVLVIEYLAGRNHALEVLRAAEHARSQTHNRRLDLRQLSLQPT